MAIRSFQDEDTATFFKRGRVPKKKGWTTIQAVARRKLDMLDYASELRDLRSPPGNRLESLSGNWQGWHSIRINDQWRIVFRWDGQPYDVQIIDYH